MNDINIIWAAEAASHDAAATGARSLDDLTRAGFDRRAILVADVAGSRLRAVARIYHVLSGARHRYPSYYVPAEVYRIIGSLALNVSEYTTSDHGTGGALLYVTGPGMDGTEGQAHHEMAMRAIAVASPTRFARVDGALIDLAELVRTDRWLRHYTPVLWQEAAAIWSRS